MGSSPPDGEGQNDNEVLTAEQLAVQQKAEREA